MVGVVGGGGGDGVGMIVGGVFHTARNNNGRRIVYNGRRMLCRFGRDDTIDVGGLLVHIDGREGGRYDTTMLLMLILTKLMKGGGKEQRTLTTRRRRRGSDAIFGVDFVG